MPPNTKNHYKVLRGKLLLNTDSLKYTIFYNNVNDHSNDRRVIFYCDGGNEQFWYTLKDWMKLFDNGKSPFKYGLQVSPVDIYFYKVVGDINFDKASPVLGLKTFRLHSGQYYVERIEHDGNVLTNTSTKLM